MRLVLLTTFLLGTLFGCGMDRYTWNQRMTVTVETPEGVVSASSVIEVRAEYYEGGELLTATEVRYSYTGEAVALEVRPGRWLFALIDDPAELMYHASPDRFGGIARHDRGAWLAAIPEQTEPVELTEEFRPTLVTFGDVNDPWSAIEVDPNDLSAALHGSVALVSITLEITSDGPESGRVESVLPTLGEFPENRLVDEVDPWNRSFAQSLETGSFIRR